MLMGWRRSFAADGEGQSEIDACRKAAEATGVAGVPHYVYLDVTLERELGLFGREHLALLREKFSAEGLARHAGVTAQFLACLARTVLTARQPGRRTRLERY